MSLLSRLGRNVFHDRLCPVLYSFNSSLSSVIHEAPISTINNHGPWSLPSSIHLVQDPRQASLMVEFLNSKDLMLVLSILHSLIHRKGTRGLGLSFNSLTGDLYIADAFLALLVVGKNGGLATQLATIAERVPFNFLHGLDVDRLPGLVCLHMHACPSLKDLDSELNIL